MPVKIVCVIDDESSIRRSTGVLVSSLGWHSELFESAESFLARPTAHTYDCLICDIEMGEMSGLDLQRKLRDMGDRTPIIFVTAHATRRHCELAVQHGAVCVLDKPVDPEALIAYLNSVLAS